MALAPHSPDSAGGGGGNLCSRFYIFCPSFPRGTLRAHTPRRVCVGFAAFAGCPLAVLRNHEGADGGIVAGANPAQDTPVPADVSILGTRTARTHYRFNSGRGRNAHPVGLVHAFDILAVSSLELAERNGEPADFWAGRILQIVPVRQHGRRVCSARNLVFALVPDDDPGSTTTGQVVLPGNEASAARLADFHYVVGVLDSRMG